MSELRIEGLKGMEKGTLLTGKQIKHELCLMLEKIDKFLEQNNIRYSIMSGTMLGAVRHRGFIPWDDDTDIGILRADYDRLVKILKDKNEISGNLSGIGFEINSNDFWPFIKIINKDILVKEDGMSRKENLWVDIFAFDEMPTKFLDFRFKEHVFLRTILMHKSIADGFHSDWNKGLKKNVWLLLEKFVDREKLTRLYIDRCTKYNFRKNDLVNDWTWGGRTTSTVSRTLFDDLTEYQFEDVVVKGFRDYDTYLKRIYGNYMELPPEDQRVNHNFVAWKVKNSEE